MFLIPLTVGFLVGFIGSVPVAGPIAALVFKCGLDARFTKGVWIGLGNGAAEGIYAGLAFWGVGALLKPYPMVRPISMLIGAVILVVIGLALLGLFSREKAGDDRPDVPSGGGFAIGFGVTILNPTLIATYGTVVAMIHAANPELLGAPSSVAFGFGAGAGAALWFFTMMRLMERFRSRFSEETIQRITRGTGLFVLGVAAWFAYGGVVTA
jgi:threonine/homoserine/homoserine lactone efflux protein